MRRWVIIGIAALAAAMLIYTVIRTPTRENTAQAAEELSRTFGIQGAVLACAKWTEDGEGMGGSPDLLKDAGKASELAAEYNSRWSHLNDDLALYVQFPDAGLGDAISTACRNVLSKVKPTS